MTRACLVAKVARALTWRTRAFGRTLIYALVALPVAVNFGSCRDFDSDTQGAGGHAGKTSASMVGGSGGAGATEHDRSGGSGSVHGGAAGESGQAADVTPGVAPGGPGASGGGAGPVQDPVISSEPPSALAGLSLWLESSESSFETDQARVSKWKDSSGHGNHATESDPALRPRLVEDALNGFSTVKFELAPSNLEVTDNSSLRFGAEPFTIAFVGEWHNDPSPQYTSHGLLAYPGYGFILVKVEAASPYNGVAISANFAAPFGNVQAQRRLGAQLEIGTASLVSSATNLNDSKVRLYVVQRRAAGTLEMRVNGTAQGWAEIPPEVDASAPGRNLVLGGQKENPFTGSLAELVIVKGSLTDAELQGVEHYLIDKFAL